MERRALADLAVTIADRVVSALEEGSETRLAVGQWQRHQVLSVEVQQVENKIDETGAAPPVRSVPDQRKGG